MDISTLCKTYGITKCSKVVRGGESRCHSVLLAALEASPEARLLAVQDGARPLVTPALIDRTVEAAAKCGAAAPAVPVKDTIKTVAEDGTVIPSRDRTLSTDELGAVTVSRPGLYALCTGDIASPSATVLINATESGRADAVVKL